MRIFLLFLLVAVSSFSVSAMESKVYIKKNYELLAKELHTLLTAKGNSFCLQEYAKFYKLSPEELEIDLPFILSARIDENKNCLLHLLSQQENNKGIEFFLPYYPHVVLPNKEGKTIQSNRLEGILKKSRKDSNNRAESIKIELPLSNTGIIKRNLFYNYCLFEQNLQGELEGHLVSDDDFSSTHSLAYTQMLRITFNISQSDLESHLHSSKDHSVLSTISLMNEEELIKNNKLISEHTDTKDSDGNTLLHYSLRYDNLLLTAQLVNGLEVNINEQNNEGNTPLHVGLATCSAAILLGSNKINLNIANNQKLTSLQLAQNRYEKLHKSSLLNPNLPNPFNRIIERIKNAEKK